VSTRTRLLAAAGALALVVAAVIVLAPGLLPITRSDLASVTRGLAGTVGLAWLALLAGAVALFQGLWSSETPSRPPPLPGGDERSGDPETGPVVGATFDARLGAAGRVGGRSPGAEAAVREDLRRLAVATYQGVHGCDWGTAARAVEAGTWTDDPAAAAFVGGAEAPTVPLGRWFRDALSERGAFYRQAVRTLQVIDELDGGDRSGTREGVDGS